LQPVRLPDALLQKLQRNEKTAAIVLEVEPESPAHKAGMVIGDILVSISGHPVTHIEDVHAQLAADAIGKSLRVNFVRGGALQDASIVVSERAPHGAE
jgi:S1-C subfamily serine protease